MWDQGLTLQILTSPSEKWPISMFSAEPSVHVISSPARSWIMVGKVLRLYWQAPKPRLRSQSIKDFFADQDNDEDFLILTDTKVFLPTLSHHRRRLHHCFDIVNININDLRYLVVVGSPSIIPTTTDHHRQALRHWRSGAPKLQGLRASTGSEVHRQVPKCYRQVTMYRRR